jgi:UbiD family decarboxylase
MNQITRRIFTLALVKLFIAYQSLYVLKVAGYLKKSSRSLYDLPIVTHFEKDAGPFITSSIVFSENQEKGKQNQPTHRYSVKEKLFEAIYVPYHTTSFLKDGY